MKDVQELTQRDLYTMIGLVREYQISTGDNQTLR